MSDLTGISLIAGLIAGTAMAWAGRAGAILLTAFAVSAAVTVLTDAASAGAGVSAVAMTLIGASLGTEITAASLRRLRSLGLRPLSFTVLTVAAGVAAAVAADSLTTLSLPTALLAAAPGGTAAMIATSLSVGAAAEVVLAVHLLRQVAVLIALPVLVDAAATVSRKANGGANSIAR